MEYIMFDIIFWIKLSGASLGSSIAVVFKRSDRDNGWHLLQRFVIGAILGFIFEPVVINWIGWPKDLDNILAAAALGGLTSYMALQLLFSDQAIDIMKRVSKK